MRQGLWMWLLNFVSSMEVLVTSVFTLLLRHRLNLPLGPISSIYNASCYDSVILYYPWWLLVKRGNWDVFISILLNRLCIKKYTKLCLENWIPVFETHQEKLVLWLFLTLIVPRKLTNTLFAVYLAIETCIFILEDFNIIPLY